MKCRVIFESLCSPRLSTDRMQAGMLVLPVLLAMAVVPATPTAGNPPATAAKEIPAKSARQHLNERVTVQFKIQHAKFATDPDRVYLDSEKDYRHPKNLGILIEAAALPAFRKGGIEKPAEHYDGKTIRVTGKPFLRDDNVFIIAERPGDIEIIKTPISPARLRAAQGALTQPQAHFPIGSAKSPRISRHIA